MEGPGRHWRYVEGKDLYKSGKYAEALALFEEEAQEHPDSKHLVYYRALCLAGLGRIDEARYLRDSLAAYGSPSAGNLAEKLTEKIRAKTEVKPGAPRPASRSSGEYVEASSEKPTGGPSALLIAASVVAVGVLAVTALVLYNMGRSGQLPLRSGPRGTLPLAVPDKYLEATTFCPTGTSKTFTFAMFLAPADSEAPNVSTEKYDCVGALVTADWQTLRTNAEKALEMARACVEPIDDVPRNEMIQTLAVPRQGTRLYGQLAGKDIETFVPGPATVLSAVADKCGKPDFSESAHATSRSVGVQGRICWWGRIGLAIDANNTITHILFRTYPRTKKDGDSLAGSGFSRIELD